MNSLYNQFNKRSIADDFLRFKQSFNGDPKEAVMNMLNSGQITQEQLNEAQQTANQFKSLMNI